MSLPLKQQLNNQNVNLGTIETNLSTLQTQTAEAVAFHHNFVTSDANITVLVDRTTTNASKIGTLETTTTTQAGEIDQLELDISGNTARIVEINTAFTTTTDGLQENIDAEALARGNADTTLQSNIDAEALARGNADTTLQSNIDAEALARGNADTTLQANIDAEALARGNADITLQENIDAEALARASDISGVNSSIATEVGTRLANDTTLQDNIDAEALARGNADTTLQANIDAEALARGNADTTLQANIDAEALARGNADTTLQANIDAEALTRGLAEARMVFMNVAEAEGILTAGDYPFGYGFGSPSKAGFGVSIPFNATLTGIAVSCDSIDVNPSVQFFLENYNTSGTKVSPLNGTTDFSVLYHGSNKYFTSLNVQYVVGDISIKVVSPTNLTDADARYRITLFFQQTPAPVSNGGVDP